MADLTQDQIEKILESVVDIHTEQDIVSSHAVDNVSIDGDQVVVNVVLNYPAQSYHQTLSDSIKNALSSAGIDNAEVSIKTKIVKYSTQKGSILFLKLKILLPLPRVKVV